MQTLKKYYKYGLPFFGGALGFAYYYFIGCTSGSCPIQSNPYISTLYGALMASVFMLPDRKKKTEEAAEK